MPAHLISDDLKKEINEIFDVFDADKSGSIDRRELKVGLRSMGFGVTSADVNRLMEEFDKNKHGERKG